MAARYVNTKVLGRRIGDGPMPDKPSFDGDGDGFVTNPITGEDNVPAPIQAIEKAVDTVDKFNDRMKKAYGQVDEGGDGDCYSAAFNLVSKLWRKESNPEKRKNIRLVHGMPFGTGGDAKGKRFGHAWVEVEEPIGDIDERLKDVPENQRASARAMMSDPSLRTTVYDYSNGRKIEVPRALYYGLGNIEEDMTRYYTMEDMVSLGDKHGHYGPWE